MTVGARLKQERTRLGRSQTDFASLAGVKKGTQISWEKDASSPTAQALVAFSDAGADVLYILTGKHLPSVPADPDQEYVRLELDDIERKLIDPERAREPNESAADTEARVLKDARRLLEGMLGPLSRTALPSDCIERAEALLQAANDPQRLALLRVADFSQARARREEEIAVLEVWMESSPYQADYPVMERLARLALEYGVPHRVLAELHYEICHDLEEQRSAESTIRRHENSVRGAS